MSRTLSRRDKRTVRLMSGFLAALLSAEPGSWDGSLWGKVTPLAPRDFASIFGNREFFLVDDPNHFLVDILRFVAMACWHNFINTWERAGRKIWILEGGSFSRVTWSFWTFLLYACEMAVATAETTGEIQVLPQKNQFEKKSQILCKVKGRQSQLTLGPLKVFTFYWF